MSCSRTQHSDAGKARTRDPSVSSQDLFSYLPVKTQVLGAQKNHLIRDFTIGLDKKNLRKILNIF